MKIWIDAHLSPAIAIWIRNTFDHRMKLTIALPRIAHQGKSTPVVRMIEPEIA